MHAVEKIEEHVRDLEMKLTALRQELETLEPTHFGRFARVQMEIKSTVEDLGRTRRLLDLMDPDDSILYAPV
jgi:hypothetical protein